MDKVDRASGCGSVNIDLFIQIRAGALNFAGRLGLGKKPGLTGSRRMLFYAFCLSGGAYYRIPLEFRLISICITN